MDPKKVEAIKKFPRPTNATELRSFLGIAGYYRRFIRGFARTSAALHAETSTRAKGFECTEEMKVAFRSLKEMLTSQPFWRTPTLTNHWWSRRMLPLPRSVMF